MNNPANNSAGSSHNSKKLELRKILEDRNSAALLKWALKERNAMRVLASLLFDEDELIVWRTIEAFGNIAPDIAERDIEKIRKQIQKFLWMMNDESGALCWRAPEAIAEIIANVEPFQKDFALILASFLIEEPFEAGTRWGMTRLINKRTLPDELLAHYRSFEKIIIDSIGHENTSIAGNAIILSKALNLSIPEEIRNSAAMNKKLFTYYDFDSGEMRREELIRLI